MDSGRTVSKVQQSLSDTFWELQFDAKFLFKSFLNHKIASLECTQEAPSDFRDVFSAFVASEGRLCATRWL